MKNLTANSMLLTIFFSLLFNLNASDLFKQPTLFKRNPRAHVLLVSLSKGGAQDNGGTPWYAVFQIGKSNTPDEAGQELKFMMDTGTANFWVTSWQCNDSGGATHNLFNKNYSTTWAAGSNYPTVYNQELGDWGEFTFNYGIDSFSFKAIRTRQNKRSPYKIRKTNPDNQKYYDVSTVEFQMAVDLIDGETAKKDRIYYNRNWDQLVCDGGMGFPLVANDEVESDLFLDKLVDQGLVGYKILSFWTDPDLNRGELVIGGWNSNIVNYEDFNKLEVNEIGQQQNAWIIDLDHFKVGENQVELPTKVGNGPNLQLDTGSSRFKGDSDYIDSIVSAITSAAGHGTVIYDEEQLNDFPDLTITLGGVNYILKPSQYFQKFVEYDSETNEGRPYWKLAFGYLAGMDGILLVGSIFLDTVYSVYLYPETFMGNENHMIYLGKYTYK